MRGPVALGICLLALAIWMPAPARAQALIADLSSHLIAITTGFTGTEVLLFGAVEGPGDVVVVVRGPDERVTVRQKGRVAGIYVNKKDMTFGQVPSFYLVGASRAIDKIAPAAELSRQEIGTEYLRLAPVAERDPAVVAEYRKALLRAKEEEGLYSKATVPVTFLGARLFRVNVTFPSNVPVGTYQVRVFLVRGGTVVGAQTTPLVISKVGASADIFDFAHRYAAAYGASAIIIALASGWLAGAIFRRV
jgi:uncharacterized protein (TIGR02186 family)